MNFLQLAQNFSLFFLLIGNVASSLMQEYFKVTGNKQDESDPRSPITVEYLEYTKFLADYFAKDPINCLEEAYSMGDFAFYELFFKSLCQKYSQFSRTLPRPGYRLDGAFATCEKIRGIVMKYLFEPFNSKEDMETKFSIIKQLIKFIKKYIDVVYCGRKPNQKKRDELLKNINTWNFVMGQLSLTYSEGKFDYNYFSSTLFPLIEKKDFLLPKYDESKDEYYYLFTAYVHHIIKLKETKFFDSLHPNSPFLIAFILSHINFAGNSSIPKYDQMTLYYSYLEDYFGPKTKFENLIEVLLWRKSDIVAMAKTELGSKCPTNYSISDWVYVWKDLFPNLKNENFYNNIWWQLNGLAVLEDFLRSLKCRRYRQNAKNE
jgi:hypothetical protein